jgi:hypothetical protein
MYVLFYSCVDDLVLTPEAAETKMATALEALSTTLKTLKTWLLDASLDSIRREDKDTPPGGSSRIPVTQFSFTTSASIHFANFQ